MDHHTHNKKIPGDMDAEPLQWWKANERQFPLLAAAARQILAVPASSGPSERIFSKMGRLSHEGRVNTKPETADVLGFLAKNDI